mmetsp:Transcript_13994/g.23780  ORF Transcript_13994/g.23780 Transcript_13994/m.23780 type:complete len:137 (-) Transcript_13994:223-633(-)
MINEALNSNNKAAIEEARRDSDPAYFKKQIKQAYFREKIELRKRLEEVWLGDKKQFAPLKKYLNPDLKGYLVESAAQAEKSGIWAQPSKMLGDRLESFGWDVFNEDSLYRAYNKRTKKIEKDLVENPKFMEELTEE